MKIVKVHDRLVLTEYGDMRDNVAINFEVDKDEFLRIIKIDDNTETKKNEDNKYSFENNTVYKVEAILEVLDLATDEFEYKTTATGMLAIVNNHVTPVAPIAYMLESQHLWETLAALSLRLSNDEKELNILMNGYTTE